MLVAFFLGGWLCIKKQLHTQGLKCYTHTHTHQTLRQCHWLSWWVKADVWLQDDYAAMPFCLVLEGFRKCWHSIDKFKGVLLWIGFPLGTFISLYTFTIRNWRNVWCILITIILGTWWNNRFSEFKRSQIQPCRSFEMDHLEHFLLRIEYALLSIEPSGTPKFDGEASVKAGKRNKGTRR